MQHAQELALLVLKDGINSLLEHLGLEDFFLIKEHLAVHVASAAAILCGHATSSQH